MNDVETAAPALAAGDVAILKSGGPMMTVASILGDMISCVWFSDEEDAFRFEELPAAVLTAVDFDDLEDVTDDEEDEEEDDEAVEAA